MQMIQHYAEHAKQVNDMQVLTALRKISILFRDGQVIQIVFLTVQKQKLWSNQLKEEKVIVKCNNITLERVSEWKLYGTTFDEHFHFGKHMSKLLKDCYSSLSMLKKLKRYTTLPVQKQLTESLIFSRLDYCNNLFIDLPQYQMKCLLKLQKACASFVLNKYAACEDTEKLKWLLVPERINFTIVKVIFKSLLKEAVPENLEIQVRTSNWSLRTPNKMNPRIWYVYIYMNIRKMIIK